MVFFFFFQAEDGIRDLIVTGVQTCALPIFGAPGGLSVTWLRARITDARGNAKTTYRDPADHILAIEEHVGTRTPTTTYGYDPLGQLLVVRDAANNQTEITYDLAGRRTSLRSPDAGLIEFAYDAAGNLTSKVDSNLRASNGALKYDYDFNRLTKIGYPLTTNVVFEYGTTGAPENAAGRITKVKDHAGVETRGYGKLGELTRSTRIVPGTSITDPVLEFVTRFEWDSFGRMLSLIYPDGDRLDYGYDKGGLLTSASVKRGTVTE